MDLRHIVVIAFLFSSSWIAFSQSPTMDLKYRNSCNEQYFSAVRVFMVVPKPASNALRTFSVNRNGSMVEMSSGNLQRNTSDNTFRFASEQTDVLSEPVTSSVSSVKKSRRRVSAPVAVTDSWTDDFGWGTSGYSDSTSSGYGPAWDNDAVSPNIDNNSGVSSNYDWGYYNDIYGKWSTYDSMGTRTGLDSSFFPSGLWRTLTDAEWDYMLNGRVLVDGLRPSTFCTVNGAGGLIVFPDQFSLSEVMDTAIVSNLNDSKSVAARALTSSQFQTLEWLGCIFLPQTTGYWSSTASDASAAQSVAISSATGTASVVPSERMNGLAVRLVRDVYSANDLSAIDRK